MAGYKVPHCRALAYSSSSFNLGLAHKDFIHWHTALKFNLFKQSSDTSNGSSCGFLHRQYHQSHERLDFSLQPLPCSGTWGGVSWHGEASFNLHPILMVLGFLLPAGEGVLAYKGGLNGSKRYVKTGHLILNTVALILGSLGVAAAFKYQFEKKADHMYSIHSWLGLATILLFAFQWLVGYVTFWYPGASEAKKTVACPWLGFLSRFVCLLGLATAETGLIERANYLVNANELEHYSLEATLINVVGALMPLLGAVIIYGSVQPKKMDDVIEEDGVYAPLKANDTLA